MSDPSGRVDGMDTTGVMTLLLGLLIDSSSSTNVWMSLVMLLLLLPAFLGALVGSDSDSWLHTVVAWIPTASISRLLALAMCGPVTLSDWWLDAVRLAASTVLLVPLISWRLRRIGDRG